MNLHVRESGRGAPLLLLHGFTGSSEAWGEGVLAALATSYRLLAVDLPGHGRSPSPPSDYGVPALLGDLSRVLDRAGAESASWIGYSMGGRMALAAAVLSPERVERLVLESASPGLADDGERAARREADEALARRIVDEGLEDFVDRWMTLPLFATQRELPPEVRAAARARRLDNEPERLAASLRTLGTGAQPSFWDSLGDVVAPTLVVTGSEDGKFLEIGERMARGMPDATLSVVPGAGHTVHLERPGDWLERVRSFLG